MSTHYNDQPADASRPFDRGRDGFVLGEGAWMMVLEREDRARARGARVYATIDGYGSTCDAYHRVQMDPDGEQIVRAMRAGRRAIGTTRSRRSATSTSTARRPLLNDAVEVTVRAAVVRARRADRVPGSSTKSMIGHPQGASGAAGIVTAALALRDGFLPPTINQETVRSGLRPRLHPERRPRRRQSRRRCATASGSDRRTARSWWGGREG